MKLKLKGILALFIMLFVQLTFAQDKTASGVVTDQAGFPIPGANVLIKGTKNGTQTDFDGKFKVTEAMGKTLVFSYQGMKTVEMAAGINMKVKLSDDSVQLEGVIVTAQGIKREKKSLGYAVAEIKSASIEQRAEGDLARVISGKASGVRIQQASGISGSATNINIRGLTSITGNNQPLFIVDGVPFSGDTNSSGSFADGNSGSSRFLDLDPNNIAKVNILKGFAAATLYGTAGKNGVILITTKSGENKKGSKKSEITFNQSVFMNEIASLPDYQNSYGNGFDQAFGNFFSNWGPGFNSSGPGSYTNAGSNIAADGTYLHPYNRSNLATVFPEYQGVRLPWAPVKNNVKDFFRVGFVLNTSMNLAGNSDDGKINYNFNLGHLADEGFTPGNKLTRTSFSTGGKAQLSNKFTVSGTLNFSRTNFGSPPVARSGGSGVEGGGLSIFADLFYTPRNVDLTNWPYQNPITGSNVSYRTASDILNPYWTLNNSFVKQFTNRTFGNGTLNYEINDNLNLLYRVGYDFYNERNELGTNRGAPTGPVLGEYRTYDNNNMIWDHNFILNGSYKLTDNLGFNFNTGATSRQENFDRVGLRSVDQGVFGVFKHFNFATQSANLVSGNPEIVGNPIQYNEVRNIIGLYAQTEFDYNKYLYLTLAARNDWVSNTINNTMFYPSVSLALIPTEMFKGLKSEKGLNYLKLRTGWGNSAGFADGYAVANNIVGTSRNYSDINGVVSASQGASNTLGNPNLKPELYSEIEFGIESKFLSNRVTLDASFFLRKNKNLITENPISNSTGYTDTFSNIGLSEGEGLEIDLGVDVIKNKEEGFNWNISTNFTKNKTIVKELGSNNNLTIAGFTNLGNQAIVGEQLGVMVGSRVKRDVNGNLVVNSAGDYVIEEGNFIIGNPNPDFILNTTNTFTYKNFNLNFLINYTSGGDIYSQTIAAVNGRGLTEDTIDRLATFVLPGVKADGTTNDIGITNSAYWFNNIGFGAQELRVFDASVVRLQELSFGYNLPKKWLDNSPFGSLGFTLSGYNLYYNAFNTPEAINFDPNITGTGVGNGGGFDFLNGPSGKRYGFSLKATF
jgi:TonB-linked SusC/RagA family outer membrane protein